jgi:ABC-type lipoprotein release transport system permease subunit
MRYDGGRYTTSKGVLGTVLGGLAFKNLFRRKMRTALTLVAIGIGIGSVVSMNGIIAGVFGQLNSIATGSNAHLMAIEAGVSDMGYSAIDESIGARLAAHPEIARVSGVVVWVLMDIPEVPFFVLWGYHPQEAAIGRFRIVEGEPLRTNRQIVLGRAFADASGKQVGDTIRLGESAFRVVGIFETGTPFEEIGGLITRRDTQMLAGKPHQVNWYSIELRDPAKVDEVMAWLEKAVPGIEVSVTAEFTESLPDLESSRAMMGGLAVLMALVGSVGMTNTILMSVLERTQEIGVLRALGWSRWRVMSLILKESLLLGMVGGLAGIGSGILLARALESWPGIGELLGSATFSPVLLAQAIAVALVLGALGGLYPAWRATRLSPVEALRYE